VRVLIAALHSATTHSVGAPWDVGEEMRMWLAHADKPVAAVEGGTYHDVVRVECGKRIGDVLSCHGRSVRPNHNVSVTRSYVMHGMHDTFAEIIATLLYAAIRVRRHARCITVENNYNVPCWRCYCRERDAKELPVHSKRTFIADLGSKTCLDATELRCFAQNNADGALHQDAELRCQ
jgi:hypothetical protein